MNKSKDEIIGEGFKNILGIEDDKVSLKNGHIEAVGIGIQNIAEMIKERTIKAVEALISFYDFVGDYKSDLFLAFDYNEINLSKVTQCCSLGNSHTSPLCSLHFVALIGDKLKISIDCRGCPVCRPDGLPGCMDVFPNAYRFYVEKNFFGFFGDNAKREVNMSSIEKEYRSIVIYSQIIAECYKIVLEEIKGWSGERFIKSMWSYYNFYEHIKAIRPELFEV